MKTNCYRLDRTCDAHIIARFGDAQLVKHVDGRHKLNGGSAADHIAAQEWISLFLHEAVVSSPPPVAGRTGLSEFARSVSEYCGSLASMSLLRTSFMALFVSRTRSRGGSWKASARAEQRGQQSQLLNRENRPLTFPVSHNAKPTFEFQELPLSFISR